MGGREGTARWALAGRLALRDVPLLLDYARWYLEARLGRGEAQVHREVPEALPPEEGRRRLGEIAGAWEEGPALARVRAWTPPAGVGEGERLATLLAGDASLGELVYGLVRATRPEVVVETGVATGVTSAYLLAGLADNGRGTLHSVDLPPTALIAGGHVGAAVPAELRQHWRYHWGASRRLLPRLLTSLGGTVGLFVHDSDHRYAPMRWEMEQAWAGLAPGGWLVADDADYNDAFRDVAGAPGAAGALSLVVRQEGKPACTGLLRKPR
jgi:predicted O-methyltransferase YrrM